MSIVYQLVIINMTCDKRKLLKIWLFINVTHRLEKQLHHYFDLYLVVDLAHEAHS